MYSSTGARGDTVCHSCSSWRTAGACCSAPTRPSVRGYYAHLLDVIRLPPCARAAVSTSNTSLWRTEAAGSAADRARCARADRVVSVGCAHSLDQATTACAAANAAAANAAAANASSSGSWSMPLTTSMRKHYPSPPWQFVFVPPGFMFAVVLIAAVCSPGVRKLPPHTLVMAAVSVRLGDTASSPPLPPCLKFLPPSCTPALL